MIRVGCGARLVTAMLLTCLLGVGNLRETSVKFQWCPVISRFGRVCMKDRVMIRFSGVWFGIRIEPYPLVLELIIGGRVNDTLMDHAMGIFH